MPVNQLTTSVPAWEAVDTGDFSEVVAELHGDSAATVLVIALDHGAEQLTDELTRALEKPGRTVLATSLYVSGVDAEAQLDDWLSRASTTWRFVLTGAPAAIMWARARLFAAGAMPEEVHSISTAAERVRRVFCAHCGSVQTLPVSVGDTYRCTCGVQVSVYYHYSVRQGGYLAFEAE